MPGTEARFQTGQLPGEADQYGTLLATGFGSLPTRRGLTGTSILSASGVLNVTMFRAPKSYLISTMAMIVGSGSTTAGTTLCRYGLYSVNGNGDINLIGSTPNDTTLLATSGVRYPKNLSVATQVTRGAWYASAVLWVGTTAPPLMSLPAAAQTTVPMQLTPKLSAAVAGQADLPASVAVASLGISNACFWMEML